MLFTFLKALLLGFSVSAPVGPIGVLCIRRTLSDGRSIGLACGLGAATADALYGLVAGLGLTVLTSVLIGHNQLFRVGGGAYLAYLGVRTFLSKPGDRAAALNRTSTLGAWASTFLLTVTNPMTIMSFVAMFSTITVSGLKAHGSEASVLAGGVFLGSAVWWLSLSTSVNLFRSRLQANHLIWINRVSGVVLVVFAVGSVSQFFVSKN
jgi:threonine/homoserine/homoserine lactone efflux protein